MDWDNDACKSQKGASIRLLTTGYIRAQIDLCGNVPGHTGSDHPVFPPKSAQSTKTVKKSLTTFP